ncbi:hypothetical protein CDCA_CDCA01G0416 [Cyanidium caldarium]|uniref:Uncharacterized protein n=1 Tax=Cyanidium caldarium TaxID=2771 RepID=A0AAV9IQP6_CYACA|nr:hypothetical protein CDCA_CDCA01G0416 [Cyanidium caldarium]
MDRFLGECWAEMRPNRPPRRTAAASTGNAPAKPVGAEATVVSGDLLPALDLWQQLHAYVVQQASVAVDSFERAEAFLSLPRHHLAMQVLLGRTSDDSDTTVAAYRELRVQYLKAQHDRLETALRQCRLGMERMDRAGHECARLAERLRAVTPTVADVVEVHCEHLRRVQSAVRALLREGSRCRSLWERLRRACYRLPPPAALAQPAVAECVDDDDEDNDANAFTANIPETASRPRQLLALWSAPAEKRASRRASGRAPTVSHLTEVEQLEEWIRWYLPYCALERDTMTLPSPR